MCVNVEDLESFRPLPWCKTYLDPARYSQIPGITRKPNEHSRANTLFTRTLRSSDSIRATVSLSAIPAKPNDPITEAVTLISLGSDLNGWSDTIHGGFLAVLLDECAGVLLGLNEGFGDTEPARVYTAYINISYKKPVRTPQVIVAKSKLRIKTGRKKVVAVEILDPEGAVLCNAETMFIKSNTAANL
ncbi:uncharacterized protein A1O5_02069 [Cladophialophora psammophila CBS 110553]|uniref:Thioesterase domain-containing protein n=1 Tax=Cladophialophora psammophila CBS 110553 TaxID=1182543 RepID=W9X5B8_9EURO|nr:uncharacterized protein A1O5_02069 [Cladophialophora psammophila CBS 110553]EXJ75373.1 hypothetical protein A1O5_02069 [Cladophialophora psammophila CBS 110553]